MKQEELNNILRNLLVAGNIVTVPFEQMRERDTQGVEPICKAYTNRGY